MNGAENGRVGNRVPSTGQKPGAVHVGAAVPALALGPGELGESDQRRNR
jgi:hypothetical protein